MNNLPDLLQDIWGWLSDNRIFVGVIEAVLATIVIALLAFIFRNTIFNIIKKIIPRLDSKTPHVNFEIRSKKTKNNRWVNQITVSNASNEPAYNLYVHYYEQFAGERFTVKALDSDSEISRAVLGIRDSLEFKMNGIQFDGCNATCDQQIWIEYENSVGVKFRVVSIPPSPRGDTSNIRPPRIIKRRFECMPGATLEGNKKQARKAVKGNISYTRKVRKLEIVKYNLVTKPYWRIKNHFNK
jgi:hypothetical protein